jgi:hypothetical protein
MRFTTTKLDEYDDAIEICEAPGCLLIHFIVSNKLRSRQVDIDGCSVINRAREERSDAALFPFLDIEPILSKS